MCMGADLINLVSFHLHDAFYQLKCCVDSGCAVGVGVYVHVKVCVKRFLSRTTAH